LTWCLVFVDNLIIIFKLDLFSLFDFCGICFFFFFLLSLQQCDQLLLVDDFSPSPFFQFFIQSLDALARQHVMSDQLFLFLSCLGCPLFLFNLLLSLKLLCALQERFTKFTE